MAKTVYLIGFRGVGWRDPRYRNEGELIKAGHIGIRFPDDNEIYGFHPTDKAVTDAGGEAAIGKLLKAHVPQEGQLFRDDAIFERAYILSQLGARTHVWEAPIMLHDEEYERIKSLVRRWQSDGKIWMYSFPPDDVEEMPDTLDNCATFPRRLGLPIPEVTGNLRSYLPELQKMDQARQWKPEGDEN